PAHRAYLSDFYEGGFPGSFAALAGLEKARTPDEVEAAVQRILLGHALIAGFGGIPLIYMGDELAMGNDHGYLDVPEHAHDSRWLHRPRMDWALATATEGVSARVLQGVKTILARRRATEGLHAAHPQRVLPCPRDPVLAMQRLAPTGAILGLYNFSEHWQQVPGRWLRDHGLLEGYDALSDANVTLHDDQLALPPFGRVWLR
ncbi:MAG: alpha-amylase, partial [Rhodobacteraceae bacterium]|nr:alpha-amylase [Paracoccaceae bacterium]